MEVKKKSAETGGYQVSRVLSHQDICGQHYLDAMSINRYYGFMTYLLYIHATQSGYKLPDIFNFMV